MCQHGMCRCLICHGTKASLAGMEQRISSGASGSRGALKRGLLPGFGGGWEECQNLSARTTSVGT
jgi:hypothetical protein